MECLLGSEEHVGSCLHDGRCKLHHGPVFFDHYLREMIAAGRDGLVQAAKNRHALFFGRLPETCERLLGGSDRATGILLVGERWVGNWFTVCRLDAIDDLAAVGFNK